MQEQRQRRARAPIGVFDSGAGGLTILAALQQELPDENYIYLGDTAHCPYGARSEEEIIDLTVRANHFLLRQRVKLIVVACNTASQAALSVLRATYNIPFVGVVPAVKPAARMTKRGRIGVAATNRAVKATYLQHLIEDFAADIQVYSVGCPELVTLVERGELKGEVVDKTLQRALAPLLEKDIDVLVLGCTHFPALRPAIQRAVGENVQVIDSGAAIARRTREILHTEGLTHPEQPERGNTQIWCSGEAQDFSRVASAVLGYPIIARQATL
ncbi:MAG: glutamate racemase [Ktedonobacteraceae bacterium]|nr:glutamate racemase [Ktedonobacteraceae bacterium]